MREIILNQLVKLGGGDYVSGGAGNDTLAGDDGDDTSIFSNNIGYVVLTDFNIGADTLSFIYAATGFANSADVVNAASSTSHGGMQGVEIALGSGTIFLQGITIGQLSQIDYVF